MNYLHNILHLSRRQFVSGKTSAFFYNILIVRSHLKALDFTFCFERNKYNISQSQFVTASTTVILFFFYLLLKYRLTSHNIATGISHTYHTEAYPEDKKNWFTVTDSLLTRKKKKKTFK